MAPAGRASSLDMDGFPANAAPANSRSDVETTRLNNGVHSSASGYQQIGDVISAWLVYLASRVEWPVAEVTR